MITMKKARDPLHKQAERYLRQLIEEEDYKNGKLLPSETDMSEQLNISRNTLRQAITTLVNEGLLNRRKGYGTKVVRKGIVSGVQNWLSFSQEMMMLGVEVKNYELHISYKEINKEIQNFLEVTDEKAQLLVLERVRGNMEYPFVYFISYFNPSIPLNSDMSFNEPLYDILEKKYDVIVKTSKEEITAGLAGDFIGSKLRIHPNDPILIRKRFVYDENNVPIEYNIGYYKADSFVYTIEAHR